MSETAIERELRLHRETFAPPARADLVPFDAAARRREIEVRGQAIRARLRRENGYERWPEATLAIGAFDGMLVREAPPDRMTQHRRRPTVFDAAIANGGPPSASGFAGTLLAMGGTLHAMGSQPARWVGEFDTRQPPIRNNHISIDAPPSEPAWIRLARLADHAWRHPEATAFEVQGSLYWPYPAADSTGWASRTVTYRSPADSFAELPDPEKSAANADDPIALAETMMMLWGRRFDELDKLGRETGSYARPAREPPDILALCRRIFTPDGAAPAPADVLALAEWAAVRAMSGDLREATWTALKNTTKIPHGDTSRVVHRYETPEDVERDFGSRSPEYETARAQFGASPVLAIYSGPCPANLTDPTTGNHLATTELPPNWLAGGDARLHATVTTTGRAGYFRIWRDRVCFLQGTIGRQGSGADIQFDTDFLMVGQDVNMTFRVTGARPGEWRERNDSGVPFALGGGHMILMRAGADINAGDRVRPTDDETVVLSPDDTSPMIALESAVRGALVRVRVLGN